MRRKRIYALVAGLAAVAAVALMLAYVVLPGDSADVKSPEVASVEIAAPAATPAVQEVASAPGGHVEGIAVHGHWTIEVRNPDGSLVERREFDNALVGFGRYYLASILSRELTTGSFQITFEGTPTMPCLYDYPTPCYIVEPGDPFDGDPFAFSNLTVTMFGTISEAAGSKVILSGHAVVANNTSINIVRTKLFTCLGTASPADCASRTVTYENFGDMAMTTLPSPIAVQEGQAVMITVEISFS